MGRVCVVGGGTAGVAAALAAVKLGSSVALLEESRYLRRHPDTWPAYLKGSFEGPPRVDCLLSNGVDVRFGNRVAAVAEGPSIVTPLDRTHYDSVVVATGSSAAVSPLPGSEKPGVHILDSPEAYLILLQACPNYSKVIVSGRGFAALETAENLLRLSMDTALVTGGGLPLVHFSLSLRRMVLEAAEVMGLRMLTRPIRKVAGVGKVEAAIVGEEVLPCDAVAVAPPRVPSSPQFPLRRGRKGGLVIDGEMRCGIPGVFAAGDCAEYPLGDGSRLIMLGPTSEASGRVAGANAAGMPRTLYPVGCFSRRLFGLSIAAAGLGLGEALSLGFESAEAVHASSPTSVASVVFHRKTRRVLGIQHVGTRGPPAELLSLAVSREVRLEELAVMENSGSTDISSILEAAREGVDDGQGPGV